MKLENVDIKTFDEYVLNSYKPHFMQTGAWGDVNVSRGAKAHRLLLKDEDRIVGSALLIEKKVLNYSTFYCPRGFITDFTNKEDIKSMVTYLKEYVNKCNGLYFKIDPDIIIRKLNADTTVKEEFEDNLALISFLEELGGKHRGFVKKLNETSAPRYTFRKDISVDDLLSSFHQTTRNLLKRNNPYGLNVYIGDEKDLDKFYAPMKETAIRKHMFLEDKKFFDDFYKILHKYDMSDLYVVTVKTKEVKEKYNSLIEAATNELKELEGSNKKGRINDLNDQLKKYNKELNILNDVKDEEIVLSSMITVKFGEFVWTIHGANASGFPFLNANYEMYWRILKDAKEMGYKYVDFYGTEGEIDKKSEAYGIYQFKVRFAGDFDEFIGEFDFITKPLQYKVINKLLITRRRLLYKIQKFKHKNS